MSTFVKTPEKSRAPGTVALVYPVPPVRVRYSALLSNPKMWPFALPQIVEGTLCALLITVRRRALKKSSLKLVHWIAATDTDLMASSAARRVTIAVVVLILIQIGVD